MHNNIIDDPAREPRQPQAPPVDSSALPPPYPYSFLCCDIVKRMEDDIDCLSRDAVRLIELKSTLEKPKKRYEKLYGLVFVKLKHLPSYKIRTTLGNPEMTKTKAFEARDFLTYTWSLASSFLGKKAMEKRFNSIRGIWATDYVTQLIKFIDYINLNFGDKFENAECSAFFSQLTLQLVRLEPAIIEGDTIEFTKNYIDIALPALNTLKTVINTYAADTRLLDFNDLCNKIFNRGPTSSNGQRETRAINVLASSLRGELLGLDTVPVAEGRARNFYPAAAELALYLLEATPEPSEPQFTVLHARLGPGLLDPCLLTRIQSAVNGEHGRSEDAESQESADEIG